VLLFAAFLTAYYTFRLYFRVFEGPEILPAGVGNSHVEHDPHEDASAHLRVDDIQHPPSEHDHAHEPHEHHDHEPKLMIWPLVVLAMGAIFAGYFNFPGHQLAHFLGRSPSLQFAYHKASITPAYTHPGALYVNPEPFGQEVTEELKEAVHASHDLHRNMMIGSGLIALFGIYCAYVVHLKKRGEAERLAARFPQLVTLLEHKYWIDEIYQAAIVQPLWLLGRACYQFDRIFIDGTLWTISFIPQLSGFALKLTTQRGYLQGYALAMILGIAVILLVIFT
jgi:NADH-quinone oxidoreductase subunit L